MTILFIFLRFFFSRRFSWHFSHACFCFKCLLLRDCAFKPKKKKKNINWSVLKYPSTTCSAQSNRLATIVQSNLTQKTGNMHNETTRQNRQQNSWMLAFKMCKNCLTFKIKSTQSFDFFYNFYQEYWSSERVTVIEWDLSSSLSWRSKKLVEFHTGRPNWGFA